jgi:pimeloyl-ACP methyl ester carboxylesterase
MVFGGRVVAFCGPSMAGKSTVALALARRGFELLSEDGVVVSGLPHSPLAWPGPDGIRVRERSGETTVRRGAEIKLHPAPAMLSAVVIMGRRHADASAVVAVGSAAAAAAIARSAAFAGAAERRLVLALAAATAATVPTFVLHASNDLHAFEEGADDLAGRVVALLT